MPWDDAVLHAFQQLPSNPSKADFHGPYNQLLHAVFPADAGYTLHWHNISPSGQVADIMFIYEVLLEDSPVFLLALMPPQDLKYSSKRENADRQIRRRIHDLSPTCILPVLHATSAFGTRLRFYAKHRTQPSESDLDIPPDPEMLLSLEDRWDCDILEEEGEARFKSVSEEIKLLGMCNSSKCIVS